jgi:hypothetical protein
MRDHRHRLAAAALLVGSFSLAPGAARAGVPAGLTEQGRLFDQAGSPLQGTPSITFSIYASPAGGVALWTETQLVPLDEGYFSAQLGAVTPVPAAVWDGSVRYVGIAVGADAEMTPREATRSVPYALVSGDAVGDLHPTTVTVNGHAVIDASGNWVGPATGLIGPTGPQGQAGAAGTTGATGAAGAVGPTGPQGASGAAGAAGPQGPIGPVGATGAVGPTGPQGAAGTSGTNGLNGTNGAVGPTGPQGAAGTNGTNGAVGPTGPQGAAGTTGAFGPTGPQGPQGPTGILAAGSAAGNTPYWNGSAWVTSSSNLFNNGANVGIGTASPGAKLDVLGTLRVADGSQGAGKVLRSDASGLAGWQDNLPGTAGATTILFATSTTVTAARVFGTYTLSKGIYAVSAYHCSLSWTPAYFLTEGVIGVTAGSISGFPTRNYDQPGAYFNYDAFIGVFSVTSATATVEVGYQQSAGGTVTVGGAPLTCQSMRVVQLF